jgi:hypothetical protein
MVVNNLKILQITPLIKKNTKKLSVIKMIFQSNFYLEIIFFYYLKIYQNNIIIFFINTSKILKHIKISIYNKNKFKNLKNTIRPKIHTL